MWLIWKSSYTNNYRFRQANAYPELKTVKSVFDYFGRTRFFCKIIISPENIL